MLNILIADDHDVVRRGLRGLLQDEFQKVRFGEARNGAETLQQVASRDWSLILLDVMMPDSNVIELITEIRRLKPGVPVLILTAAAESEYAVKTLRAGANGYITKQYASDELVMAVNKILSGEAFVSREALKELTADLKTRDLALPHSRLSPRELEIFRMIALAKSVKEIASELSLSEKTVATHLARIREKTGFSNYVEMTRYAIQNKLVD